jgi:hypothetical protein
MMIEDFEHAQDLVKSYKVAKDEKELLQRIAATFGTDKGRVAIKVHLFNPLSTDGNCAREEYPISEVGILDLFEIVNRQIDNLKLKLKNLGIETE